MGKGTEKQEGYLKTVQWEFSVIYFRAEDKKENLESDETTKLDGDVLFLSYEAEGCLKLKGSELNSSKQRYVFTQRLS